VSARGPCRSAGVVASEFFRVVVVTLHTSSPIAQALSATRVDVFASALWHDEPHAPDLGGPAFASTACGHLALSIASLSATIGTARTAVVNARLLNPPFEPDGQAGIPLAAIIVNAFSIPSAIASWGDIRRPRAN
jgi:hypothetical protein